MQCLVPAISVASLTASVLSKLVLSERTSLSREQTALVPIHVTRVDADSHLQQFVGD